MEFYSVLVFVSLVLCCCLFRSSRIQESAVDAILSKDWYWIWCHTETFVGNVSYTTHERIDAVFASTKCVAEMIARSRHGIKPNMRIETVRCVDEYDRSEARKANQFVTEINERFEEFMKPEGTSAHKDRS
jgi:hypothetical protein